MGYVVLVFFALVFIAPFIITLVTSFKTDTDATLNPLSPIPHPVTLSAWDQIFGIGSTASVTDIPRWLFNSAFVAAMITLARVVLDSLAGYALARLEFRGRRLIFALHRGHHGRPRCGAPDPAVPGPETAPPFQLLPGDDHPDRLPTPSVFS